MRGMPMYTCVSVFREVCLTMSTSVCILIVCTCPHKGLWSGSRYWQWADEALVSRGQHGAAQRSLGETCK